MKLLDKVKALFTETEMAEDKMFIKTKDGIIFAVTGTELAVDAPIVMIDEAGVEQPIEDGDYILEDDSTISVKGGLVSVITPEAETPAEEVAEDNVEEEVMAELVIPQGDYTLENGDVITIDDKGMVINIIKAPEVMEEVVAEAEVVVDPRIAELEAALELSKIELESSKQAFEKLKSEPAAKALDIKKFEKTEVKTSKDSMLSKVTDILNKK